MRWRVDRPTRSWSGPSRCSARRGARCASGPWRRWSGVSRAAGPAFEALARVLLQREGFGPATFVKRVEGTIYVEALRGRGPRSSRCLVGLQVRGGSGGRRAIGELRAGIRARQQDEGLLMLAGRLAEDAIAERKQPATPVEMADGPGDGRDLHPPRRRRHQRDGQRRLRRRRLLRRDRRGVAALARLALARAAPFAAAARAAGAPARAVLRGEGPETLLLCEHHPVDHAGPVGEPAHVLRRGTSSRGVASTCTPRRAAATSPTTGPGSWSATRWCGCAGASSVTWRRWRGRSPRARRAGDRRALAARDAPGLWVGGQ